MACQAARRASRGCEETGAVAVPVDADANDEEEEEERLARRVSWMPGAEGAPLVDVEWVGPEVLAERLVVMVGCEDWGTMRRDCEGLGNLIRFFFPPEDRGCKETCHCY